MPIAFRGRRQRSAEKSGESGATPPSDLPRHEILIQRVIDAVDALVVVVALDGTLWLWNQRCAETSGAPLSDVAGQPLWSVMRLRSNFKAQAQTAFDQLVAGGAHSVEFQSQWLRKDGRKARVSWVARLIDAGDGLRCVMATGTEATRGQKVAREIAETESRFETLLEVLPDPVVVHQGGRAVFVNRAALELYGAASLEDLADVPILERVSPAHRPFVAERVRRMLTQGESVPMADERHLKLDGTEFDVEVIAAPVVFDGRPAVELVARDVTERNATIAALRASEARVRAVFDQSTLGMVVVDRTGHPLECNAAFQRLLGYAIDELRAMTVTDFTHVADRADTMTLIRAMFKGENDGFVMEKRYIHRDGREVWGRTHASPISELGGLPTLALATIEDITEAKQLTEQLRQASKMEALGRLASGVAHDFNNLLTVVNGYADLLALSLEGDERAADAAEIRKAGSRAAELTSQLLAFGRRSKRALEPVNLNARVEAMVPMLRRLLGEDVDFAVTLDKSLGMVEADPSQLDQLIMNLVVNGRDAMPSGGSLTLTTSPISTEAYPGRDNSSEWACLEIVDTGFGMDPEVLEHIFEPFFTTKGQGKGTGLGLATVYGIVQQMGGHIQVASSVGVGSRFAVELPLCASAPSSELDGPINANSRHHGSETILLVEDEPTVRDFCRRALTADGYVVHAAGPREAIDIADELGVGLDILVTDVVMPDFDGPTIAAALSSRRRDLKVLFMSGYPRDLENELTGPAADGAVLAKPFTPRELCDAVRRVLDRGVRRDG